MEGACVYNDKDNNPVLLMYKEWNPNTIFFSIYSNKLLKTGYIETRLFTEFIPRNSIHLLTKLPLDKNSEFKTLEMWKSLIKYRLIIENNKNKLF